MENIKKENKEKLLTKLRTLIKEEVYSIDKIKKKDKAILYYVVEFYVLKLYKNENLTEIKLSDLFKNINIVIQTTIMSKKMNGKTLNEILWLIIYSILEIDDDNILYENTSGLIYEVIDSIGAYESGRLPEEVFNRFTNKDLIECIDQMYNFIYTQTKS